MTQVTIKRTNGKITEVKCLGHTDFGEEGADILCASLSSIIQTAVLGLMQVACIPVEYKTEPSDGLLELKLTEKLDSEDRINADMILETMLVGVADLATEYGKFIKLVTK